MSDQSDGSALSGEISADGVKAHVGNKLVAAIGDAATWLMPGRHAKVQITRAVTERLTSKIAAGQPLDEHERLLMSLVFRREAGKLANQLDVVDRTNSVLPAVGEQIKHIESAAPSSTTETFMRRAESIAGEIHEEELRDMFARVLAGEITKPGAFSIKTLETIRSLDPHVASTFDRLRSIAFDCEWVMEEQLDRIDVFRVGIDDRGLAELQDAGLISYGFTLELGDANTATEYRLGDLIMHIRCKETVQQVPLAHLRLTRTGREIASVLPPACDGDYFMAIGASLSQRMGWMADFEWHYAGESQWYKFVCPVPEPIKEEAVAGAK